MSQEIEQVTGLMVAFGAPVLWIMFTCWLVHRKQKKQKDA